MPSLQSEPLELESHGAVERPLYIAASASTATNIETVVGIHSDLAQSQMALLLSFINVYTSAVHVEATGRRKGNANGSSGRPYRQRISTSSLGLRKRYY